MEALLQHLGDLIFALWGVIITIGAMLVPWTPLAAWIVFWTFAVNWVKLRGLMATGGWIAIVLMGFAMILIWGVVAPPADGFHYMLGLKLSNFVGKTVYVTGLITIMFLCGSLQLSGFCENCCQFDEPEPASHGH